jgi:hypothetical protein
MNSFMNFDSILFQSFILVFSIFFASLVSPLISELVYNRKDSLRWPSFFILILLCFIYSILVFLIVNLILEF